LSRIFICYRREDSGPAAGRIYDRLEGHFERGQVFMDVDDIPLGVDFWDWLDRQIRQCDLVLVVIGRHWLTAEDADGQRRLDAPRDFVRTEIEIALKRDIPLIPVLLDDAQMPDEAALPASIAPLAYRNAATVHAAGRHFRGHMEHLIRGIEWLLARPLHDQHRAQSTSAEPQLSPEIRRLLAEIANPATEPPRRLAIGDRLAELGDPRPGVGVRADGLPDIAWVEIPAGPFIFQNGERRELPACWIAKYPVTNAQYQCFIDDGGYKDGRWWRDLVLPGPAQPSWPQRNRPRTNVGWYEAMAFCRWLTARLALPEDSVRLPTELEWEKAARGEQGLAYPWGVEYRSGFANVDETHRFDIIGPWFLGQPAAVGVYPHGRSPYGVEDLAGTVWEWCLNKEDDLDAVAADTSGAWRALRGGYWGLHPLLARAGNRHGGLPNGRVGSGGFRLLSSVPINAGR
jgi:formylglycine-generating enzyme required for sulfatase activity